MNYSEEEKEAIDKLEFLKETGYATFMIKYDVDRTTANGMIKRTIEIILNLIQKQDKIIDKFSKALVNCVGTCPIDYNDDFKNDCENCQDTLEKCWIEFFKKEVERK